MKKINVFKNVSIFLAFGVMGLVTSLIGTTYVHMEKLFDISSKTMSLSITGIYSGGLIGAGFCAAFYQRINPEINLAFTMAMAGSMTIAAFYAKDFILFAFFLTLQGVAFGVLFTAAPVYLITMWKDTRWNRPVLNCLYTFWSVGALIGPFIIRIFICDKDPSNLAILTNSTETFITNITKNHTENTHENQFSQSCLHLAQSSYLVMGCIIFSTSIPFFALYFIELCTSVGQKEKDIATKYTNKLLKSEDIIVTIKNDQVIVDKKSQLKTSSKLIIYSLLFIFTTLTISIECITMQYVVNFASKYLDWSVRSSSFLITIFFATHSISRASNIIILVYCKPMILLTINVIVCILGFGSIAMFIDRWPNIIYASISIVGFAIASIYPTEILFVSEKLQFTQSMSAISAVGTCMGGIISPFLLTSLIPSFGLMIFAYYQIFTAFLLLFIFLVQIIYLYNYFVLLPKTFV